MLESINELISSVVGSPWAYLAIFATCAVDAFFPIVLSETAVIAAAAVAASAGQSLGLIFVVAVLGAFIGDHVSYAIGRGLGRPGVRWLLRGTKGRAAVEWGQQMLRTRGGLMIVALRFVPGGRTATTLTAGMLRYPLRRFVGFDILAACAWVLYAELIGYWAGDAFEGNPLQAVMVGVIVSVGISVVVEAGRLFLRRRRNARGSSGRDQPEDGVVREVR